MSSPAAPTADVTRIILLASPLARRNTFDTSLRRLVKSIRVETSARTHDDGLFSGWSSDCFLTPSLFMLAQLRKKSLAFPAKTRSHTYFGLRSCFSSTRLQVFSGHILLDHSHCCLHNKSINFRPKCANICEHVIYDDRN